MTDLTQVKAWANEHPLEPAHVDCATAVMLKILDGKCKMNAIEKEVMAHLYQAVKHRPGLKIGEEMDQFIAEAVTQLDDELRDQIYEKRVLAETMISRPVMKAFKAMIRQKGLLNLDTANEKVVSKKLPRAKFKSPQPMLRSF